MNIYQLSKGYNIGRFTRSIWLYWIERMEEEFGNDCQNEWEEKSYIHLRNLKHWSQTK